ncbi:MAG: hypothetical protein A4E19_19195 [Nitrospira sp. SG-bin1]|nr:MAG: hypothetical protein A4E19_19195 [Nitrospira sp. SG-bin1]
MTNDFTSLADKRTGPMAASWLLSCLLHGGVAVIAVIFVQRMQLAPQGEPFQWDVAMVAPLSSSSTSTVSPASIAPPTPNVRPPTRTATLAPAPLRSVQPKIPSQVASSLPEPIAAFTPEHRQVQPLTESHSPDLLSSVPSDSAPLTSSQLNSVLFTDPAAPDNSINRLESPAATDIPLNSSPPANASTGATDQSKSSKADYGWLTALMTKWIEDLNKRYPVTLRTDGVQGKVTLAAMLHANGSLSDVHVVGSSGNTTLDEVALEDVRNGPSIKFSRPLGRSEMPVKFSISYDLKAAR